MRTSVGERPTAGQGSRRGFSGAVMFGVVLVVAIALFRAANTPGLGERIRVFASRRFNPLMLRFAGRRSGFFVAVEHTGRRSGRVYTTPVVGRPLDDGFVLPLPYGPGTDWCRNVLAAGTCALIVNGHRSLYERPEVVSRETALAAFSPIQHVLLRGSGIAEFLVLHRAPAAGAVLPTGERTAPLIQDAPAH